VSQPHAAQLSHVPVPEFAAIPERDEETVVAMAAGRVLAPPEVAGHPEVQDQRGTVGRPARQPLPDAFGFGVERSPAECLLQRLWRGVADDGRIGGDRRDRSAHGMPNEEPAEVFDVGEFRHGCRQVWRTPPVSPAGTARM